MNQCHEIQLVAFQKGESNRLVFSDFLNQDDKGAFVKAPLRVSYRTQSLELDVKFIVVSSLSDVNHLSFSKSQRVCDLATFVVQADYSNKLLIELHLSKYTLSLLEDDWKDERKIHLFRLKFKNCNQREGHTTKKFKIDNGQILTLVSEFEGTGIFNAEISGHRSYSLQEYKDTTGSDPLSKKALETYFNPELYGKVTNYFSVSDFIESEKK